eukprot:44770_1
MKPFFPKIPATVTINIPNKTAFFHVNQASFTDYLHVTETDFEFSDSCDSQISMNGTFSLFNCVINSQIIIDQNSLKIAIKKDTWDNANILNYLRMPDVASTVSLFHLKNFDCELTQKRSNITDYCVDVNVSLCLNQNHALNRILSLVGIGISNNNHSEFCKMVLNATPNNLKRFEIKKEMSNSMNFELGPLHFENTSYGFNVRSNDLYISGTMGGRLAFFSGAMSVPLSAELGLIINPRTFCSPTIFFKLTLKPFNLFELIGFDKFGFNPINIRSLTGIFELKLPKQFTIGLSTNMQLLGSECCVYFGFNAYSGVINSFLTHIDTISLKGILRSLGLHLPSCVPDLVIKDVKISAAIQRVNTAIYKYSSNDVTDCNLKKMTKKRIDGITPGFAISGSLDIFGLIKLSALISLSPKGFELGFTLNIKDLKDFLNKMINKFSSFLNKCNSKAQNKLTKAQNSIDRAIKRIQNSMPWWLRWTIGLILDLLRFGVSTVLIIAKGVCAVVCGVINGALKLIQLGINAFFFFDEIEFYLKAHFDDFRCGFGIKCSFFEGRLNTGSNYNANSSNFDLADAVNSDCKNKWSTFQQNNKHEIRVNISNTVYACKKYIQKQQQWLQNNPNKTFEDLPKKLKILDEKRNEPVYNGKYKQFVQNETLSTPSDEEDEKLEETKEHFVCKDCGMQTTDPSSIRTKCEKVSIKSVPFHSETIGTFHSGIVISTHLKPVRLYHSKSLCIVPHIGSLQLCHSEVEEQKYHPGVLKNLHLSIKELQQISEVWEVTYRCHGSMLTGLFPTREIKTHLCELYSKTKIYCPKCNNEVESAIVTIALNAAYKCFVCATENGVGKQIAVCKCTSSVESDSSCCLSHCKQETTQEYLCCGQGPNSPPC